MMMRRGGGGGRKKTLSVSESKAVAVKVGVRRVEEVVGVGDNQRVLLVVIIVVVVVAVAANDIGTRAGKGG